MRLVLLLSLLITTGATAQSSGPLVFTNTLPATVVINTNMGSIYVKPQATLDLTSTIQNYDLTLLSKQLTAWQAIGVLTSLTPDPVGDMLRARASLAFAPTTDGGCGAGFSAADGGYWFSDCVGETRQSGSITSNDSINGGEITGSFPTFGLPVGYLELDDSLMGAKTNHGTSISLTGPDIADGVFPSVGATAGMLFPDGGDVFGQFILSGDPDIPLLSADESTGGQYCEIGAYLINSATVGLCLNNDGTESLGANSVKLGGQPDGGGLLVGFTDGGLAPVLASMLTAIGPVISDDTVNGGTVAGSDTAFGLSLPYLQLQPARTNQEAVVTLNGNDKTDGVFSSFETDVNRLEPDGGFLFNNIIQTTDPAAPAVYVDETGGFGQYCEIGVGLLNSGSVGVCINNDGTETIGVNSVKLEGEPDGGGLVIAYTDAGLAPASGADGLLPNTFVTHEQVACPFGSFNTTPPDGGTVLVCESAPPFKSVDAGPCTAGAAIVLRADGGLGC